MTPEPGAAPLSVLVNVWTRERPVNVESVGLRSQELEAITFDVGGTLIEPWPSVGAIYAGAAKRFGYSGVAPEAVEAAFRGHWQSRGAGFRYDKKDWRDLVGAVLGAWVPPSHVDAVFEWLYEAFEGAGVWRIYDDVIPVLEALRERPVRLGVISNWDERLRPLLGHLRLAGYFEGITVSHEEAVAKPSEAIFAACLRALDVAPERVLHVGDSWREDVEGARRFGMRALLIDRSGRRPLETRGLDWIPGLDWLTAGIA